MLWQPIDAATKIGFPNTAYYLPVIYSLLGMPVKTLEDLKKPLKFARGLLPPHVKDVNHLPYLGPLLDAGMAAILAYEVKEAIRSIKDPDFYHPHEDPDLEAGKIWVGPADDIILRKRGVEFVDGSAPGFAAIVGACPSPEIAKMIVEEYQKRNLYIFCAANHNGTTVIRAAHRSRSADRLEYPYRSLRSGYFLGRFCPWFCQPRRHGLRRG